MPEPRMPTSDAAPCLGVAIEMSPEEGAGAGTLFPAVQADRRASARGSDRLVAYSASSRSASSVQARAISADFL
jgi:hypothetical protein